MPVLVIEDSEPDSRQLQQLVAGAGFGCQPISENVVPQERFERDSDSLILIGRSPLRATFGDRISALQLRFPGLPIIALTDDTPCEASSNREPDDDQISARDALQRSIAGCLPRNRIASDLKGTLQQILGSKASQLSEVNSNGEPHQRICYTIDNRPELLPLILAQVRSRLESWPVADSIELVRITVALSEALENALYHGNLELNSDLRQGDGRAWRSESLRRRSTTPYCQRRIQFRATIGEDSAQFVIRDEGPGFHRQGLKDCTQSQNLELCSGRGLLLMQMYMDDVDFNHLGNEVTLVKHRPDEQSGLSP